MFTRFAIPYGLLGILEYSFNGVFKLKIVFSKSAVLFAGKCSYLGFCLFVVVVFKYSF